MKVLVLIKPGNENIVSDISLSIVSKGVDWVSEDYRVLTKTEIKELYRDHKGKHFYNELINYMATGPCYIWIMGGEDSVNKMLDLKDEIREKHGESDTKNVIHTSDLRSVERELALFEI